MADDDDDGWGAPPKEQESSWGQHKQTQSPAPASDKQDSWKAPQQDEVIYVSKLYIHSMTLFGSKLITELTLVDMDAALKLQGRL